MIKVIIIAGGINHRQVVVNDDDLQILLAVLKKIEHSAEQQVKNLNEETETKPLPYCVCERGCMMLTDVQCRFKL